MKQISSLRRRWPFALATVVLLGSGLIQACDDDDPVSPEESITLSRSPATLSIAPGGSGTVTISIARENFDEAVTLAAENLPAGVTATFAPNNATGNTSTLTLTATPTAALGTATVTVRGTGAEITAATTTIALTVATDGPPLVTFSPISPATVSVAQGSSATAIIPFVRSNFPGTLTLTAENVPTGVTATFVPSAATSSGAALVLTAAPTAAAGSSTITIRGSGAGLTPVTTTLPVTVTTATTAASISLSPASLSVARGTRGTATVTIVRTSFTGAVTLVAENVPTGVSVTFEPPGTTGNTTTVDVGVGVLAPIGAFNIIIRATGTGVAAATASLFLTIPN